MVDIISWLTLIGFGGLLVEALRAFFQRKKMGADYADVISASAIRLLEPLEARVHDLEQQLTTCQLQLSDARREARLLREELAQERADFHHPEEEEEGQTT